MKTTLPSLGVFLPTMATTAGGLGDVAAAARHAMKRSDARSLTPTAPRRRPIRSASPTAAAIAPRERVVRADRVAGAEQHSGVDPVGDERAPGRVEDVVDVLPELEEVERVAPVRPHDALHVGAAGDARARLPGDRPEHRDEARDQRDPTREPEGVREEGKVVGEGDRPGTPRQRGRALLTEAHEAWSAVSRTTVTRATTAPSASEAARTSAARSCGRSGPAVNS